MTLIEQLEHLAADAKQKAESAETHDQMTFYRGVLFGLETAIAEIREHSKGIAVNVSGDAGALSIAGGNIVHQYAPQTSRAVLRFDEFVIESSETDVSLVSFVELPKRWSIIKVRVSSDSQHTIRGAKVQVTGMQPKLLALPVSLHVVNSGDPGMAEFALHPDEPVWIDVAELFFDKAQHPEASYMRVYHMVEPNTQRRDVPPQEYTLTLSAFGENAVSCTRQIVVAIDTERGILTCEALS
jgi:hypothetical protein